MKVTPPDGVSLLMAIAKGLRSADTITDFQYAIDLSSSMQFTTTGKGDQKVRFQSAVTSYVAVKTTVGLILGVACSRPNVR